MCEQCRSCYYADQCCQYGIQDDQCKYWEPVEDMDDVVIGQLIERNRKEFYEQWLIYLAGE